MKKSGTKINILYQMSYSILLLVLPFVTSPYISRIIGAEGLGIYSYSHSVAKYFEILSLLGIATYGNRLIAQSRDDKDLLNKNFSNLLYVHILISIVSCIGYAIYIIIDKNNAYYAILQWPYVTSLIFDISWFFFGIEQFKIVVTKNFVIKVLTVVLVFTLVRDKGDLWKYCFILAIASFASTISLWPSLRKQVKFVKPSINEMKKHILPMLVLFIPVIAVNINKYMDKIMIGSINTKTELGYYENAEKVNVMATSLIASFGSVMLPKMSNLFSKEKKGVAIKYINLSSQLIMCFAFGLCFGLAGISEDFAIVFWGSEFVISGGIIWGLSITIPFIAFANILRTQYLIPSSRDKEYIISIIVGCIVNLVINLLLIPRYGAWGATVGTIVAEISICITQIMLISKEIPVLEYIKNSVFFIPIGLIMYFVLSIIKQYLHSWIGLLSLVAIGVLVYAIPSIVLLYCLKNTVVIELIEKIKRKTIKKKG